MERTLGKAGADDATIQALGRWMNPDSIRIYRRMTTVEYTSWIDRMFKVRRLDATRTTSMPVMDAEDLYAPIEAEITARERRGKRKRDDTADAFDEAAAQQPAAAERPLPKGTRIRVYWTELDEWYEAAVLSSRMERGDDGEMQRATHVVYDAVGAWSSSTAKQLTYWHCLSDEAWAVSEQHMSDE